MGPVGFVYKFLLMRIQLVVGYVIQLEISTQIFRVVFTHIILQVSIVYVRTTGISIDTRFHLYVEYAIAYKSNQMETNS